jgi:proteic killer suppression protein
MLFRHTNKTLQEIDDDPSLEYHGGHGQEVAKMFRIRMQQIRAAANENDLRAITSLHFEKLKGDRLGQYSIRLNKKYRLIFQIEKAGEHNQLIITHIEDYH